MKHNSNNANIAEVMTKPADCSIRRKALPLLSLLLLLLLPLRAEAQTADLHNLPDDRQKLTYIKRHSRDYYFREARYGEAIVPRDTAILVVYTEFLIDANERRMDNKLDQLTEVDIRSMVKEIDVNYGNYNRIMIFCNRDKVLPPPDAAPATDANANGANAAATAATATSATAASATAQETKPAVNPPLSIDLLKELAQVESYPDFTRSLQEYRNNQKISVMGMVSSNNDLDENYIALFDRDSNTLLAILEPQTDKSFKNVVTGKSEKIATYRESHPNLKLLYFR